MKSKNYLTIAAIALSAFLSVGCMEEGILFPEDEGQEEGSLPRNPVIQDAVKQMAEEAVTITPTLSGIEVWQEGYSSSAAWLRGTDASTKHSMWSVTKTFTGMAVGLAASEGKLSLEDNVAELFPDAVAAAREAELSDGTEMTEEAFGFVKAMTVRDLLIMANGHRSDPTTAYLKKYSAFLLLNSASYLSGGGVNASLILDDLGTTMADLFFRHPFKAAPGKKFEYDSFASCLLSEIVKMKTGENTADYLYERLFKPLGLEKPIWDEIQGVSAGGWGLQLTTAEMVAFGRLFVQDGKWEGTQVIPYDYLKDAVAPHMDADSNYKDEYYTDSYGYQIWTRKDGSMYQCAGLFGQYILIFPEKKAVIALTSDVKISYSSLVTLASNPDALQNEKVLDLAWKYIVPNL